MRFESVLILAAFGLGAHAFAPRLSMSAATGRARGAARRDALSVGGKAMLGALGLGVVASSPRRAGAEEVTEGVSAPDFTLPSSLGKPVSLKDLESTGKTTVLYFFPAAFTSGCTLEAKAFQRDIDQYKALNAQVVGVSVDPTEKQVDFVKSCNLDFLLLSDLGAKVSEAYGTALDIPFLGRFANRSTYIISPDGKLVKVFTNVESRVQKHSEEVLEALRTLKG